MTAADPEAIAETARLVIRPWRLEEAPRLLDILSRVEVVRWLDDGEPKLMKDLDEARARIERYRDRADEPPLGIWAIEVRETGQVAGSTVIDTLPDAEDGELEIGWHLHPDSWGHGYASEAAEAVIAWALTQGPTEILALTHLDNYPSRAVASRIGMEDLGETDQWYEEPSQLFRAVAGTWRPRDP